MCVKYIPVSKDFWSALPSASEASTHRTVRVEERSYEYRGTGFAAGLRYGTPPDSRASGSTNTGTGARTRSSTRRFARWYDWYDYHY
eukprot:scaffold246232_cov37-Prasinocladus_malaysianus.AAC.1